MFRTTVLRSLAIAATAGLIATTAPAEPVLAGSTYSVYLTSGGGRTIAVSGIVFDGLPETHTRTVNLGGGQTQEVSFSIDETQFAIGGGAHRINISVRSDVDLYPSPNRELVGFGFGLFEDDPLDLAWPVRLDNNRASIYGGVEMLVNEDWVGLAQQYGQTQPWDGYFLTKDLFGAYFNHERLAGRSINRVDFTMQVQQIPEPGAFALAATGLLLLGLRRRGAAATFRAS